jgi:hypothetical protein
MFPIPMMAGWRGANSHEIEGMKILSETGDFSQTKVI